MTNLLLATKFHRPSGRSPLVSRDRILKRLDQGLNSQLILISAPAGFGKTTVLSEWARQVQLPVSWLSLDEHDNDLTQFWTYVVAALQQTYSDMGESTLALLRSAEAMSFELILVPLLNELAQLQTHWVLVLDDYHLIAANSIHESITFFLEHLPTQVHLAIATRTDPPLPLARWRVRAQLTELRAADLRFTEAEATAFINQSLSLPLSPAQITTLQTKTEGWIAGLQLAVLSLHEAPTPTTLIESFQGSQRYILDYLVEEVLERQPKPLQSFLLRTSILERMCGSLCAAVLGDDTINARQILEQVERKNLFVVPLDSHRTWYRYHHLFADLLRHTLHRVEPDRVSEYHHRAAQWYEQQGYIADAIGHAIAANRYEYATSLIEQEIQTNENPRFDAIALRNALAELPPQLTYSRPWLLVASSWAAFISSQFTDVVLAIQTLEQLLNERADSVENIDQMWGLVIALKGMQARHQGNTAESIAFMEKALQLLPQDHSWLRSLILLNLGVTYFVADNYEKAKPLLPEVSRIGQARGIADPAIAGLYLQGQFLALRGRLQEAIALCQQGLNLATQRRWLATYAGVLVQVALANLLREQNDLEVAAQHLSESIDRAIQNQQPGLMMGYITLARVRQAQGNWHAAWDAIHAAKQCQLWLWSTILSVEACQVRLHLAQGDLEAAMAWVQSRNLGVDNELCYNSTQQHPFGSELDYLTFARVLIAYGRTKASSSYLQDAMRLLSRLSEFTKAGGRTIRTMETLILQALAWQAWGDGERALTCLKQALEIPRQGDYIRLFVDEGQPMAELLRQAVSKNIYLNDVNRLLAAFGSVEANSLVPVQPLIEPLSDRELEVLQNLATGMSNQAIADQLFVSIAAVKWHARNIYGKLEVSNRTQAVARARELGILG